MFNPPTAFPSRGVSVSQVLAARVSAHPGGPDSRVPLPSPQTPAALRRLGARKGGITMLAAREWSQRGRADGDSKRGAVFLPLKWHRCRDGSGRGKAPVYFMGRGGPLVPSP